MFLHDPVEHPISAAEAVKAVREYAGLRTQGGSAYGVSFDSRTGKNQLCRFEAGELESILPAEFSVRSRVHEYGGGAWCLSSHNAFFVNDSDQQIWCASLSGGFARQLTSMHRSRFADLTFDSVRQRLIAICETHTQGQPEPENRLVSVGSDGRVRVLAEGADFYASPALSPDGSELAWVEWDHPNQPWLSTRVCAASLSDLGYPKEKRVVSDVERAWVQPRFSPDGVLHAVVDRDDWWSIESFNGEAFTPLSGDKPADTEFASAPWQFGLSSYGWDENGALWAIGQHRGYSNLYRHDGIRWQRLCLDLKASRLHSLALADGEICCVAEFSNRQPMVLRISGTPDTYAVNGYALHGGEFPDYPVTNPEPCGAPLPDGSRVPYFLYRGVSAGVAPSPTIIFIHGGPTASTAPILKSAIQFWTQRGYMVADVNYRGSTGYGRSYRMMLAGRWGESDVEDVESVAHDLIYRGLADPGAMFIRGNSAGGYTALSALANSSLFTAGASLYGVSEPSRLNDVTHKFESRYLSWLIGDPVADSTRYLERSPLHNAHRISSPVIFFQGEEDKVVLPEQTREMATRLREQGVPVETHYFSDEGHGFRSPVNQISVLELELAFYSRWISQ
ncbi:Coenzyme PQQ synthesis protein F [Marinobacterium lacunae]|uniref:Coenzyme PQQ synthesis protein F n=1 Tax=Marinobacterium lacunae TaxID=1232683 RepID=A0A081FTQ5_9GAMM|nr:Coenzyme PQQ synthesis protein F [Marinobacterium lacunae]